MVLISSDVYDSLAEQVAAEEEQRRQEEEAQRQADEAQRMADLAASAQWDVPADSNGPGYGDAPAQTAAPNPWEQAINPQDPWAGYDAPQTPAQDAGPWDAAQYQANPDSAFQQADPSYQAPPDAQPPDTQPQDAGPWDASQYQANPDAAFQQADPSYQAPPDAGPWDASQYQSNPDSAFQQADPNYQAQPSWQETVANISKGFADAQRQQEAMQRYNESGYTQAGQDALAQQLREDQQLNPIDRSDASRWAYSQGYALDGSGNLNRPGFANAMDLAAPAMSLNEFLKSMTGGKANIEFLPDGAFEVVDALGSPLSLATMGLGGGEASLAANFGKNAAAVVGGLAAQKGAQAYSQTDLPGADIAGNPWVQQGAALVGGAAGFMGAEGLANAYKGTLGPEGSVIRGVAKAQGREGLDPAIGLGIEDVTGRPGYLGSEAKGLSGAREDMSLATGDRVYDPVSGKEMEVTRKFVGDEQGKVTLRDPETGETIRRPRMLLKEPGANAAQDAVPEAALSGGNAAEVTAPEGAVTAPEPRGGVEPPIGQVRPGATADGAAIEPLPRTSAGDIVPPTEPPPPVTPEMPFADALITHLRGEQWYRSSGQAADELRAGRARQARGIMEGLSGDGKTGEQMMADARAGAKGKILSGRDALELTPAQADQAYSAIARHAVENGSPFDVLQGDTALKKMLSGERLQPGEIRTARRVFGPDVADLLAQRPETPASKLAVVRAQQAREAGLLVKNTERALSNERAARLKALSDAQDEAGKAFERVQRQAAKEKELATAQAAKTARETARRNANDLVKNVEGAKVGFAKATAADEVARLKALSRVDTQRAKVVEAAQKQWEGAQAKALKAANDADAAEIRQARAYQEEVAARNERNAQTAATRENRADVKASIAADKLAFKAANDADAAEIRQARAYQEEVAARNERNAQTAATRENRADVKASIAADKLNPNDEMLLNQAKEALGESSNASALNREAVGVVESLLRTNRAVLDSIGEAGTNRLQVIARTIRDAITGGVGDSYVNHLAMQETIARSALEAAGVESQLAKKVADALTEQELARRYGSAGAVPPNIRDLLKKTGSGEYGDAGATMLRGAAAYGQMAKNTMFGPLDLGLGGVQGLKALGTGSLQLTAGLVNRAAATVHLPHVDVMAGSTLGQRAQYAIDGVIHGITTGATDVSHEGTLLSAFGKPGRILDTPVRGLINANDRFQFGLVLGTLRDIIHEGNLTIARAVGSDISDPAVRMAAAERANSATSAARAAVSGKRALAEKGFLMTPSMRRAQVEQVTQVIDGFLHPANRAEFALSAATIASTGIGLLTVGKVLNDRFGMTDFVFDPTDPGFGRIAISIGGKIYSNDMFPQEQILKYTSQAVRALIEGNPEDARAAFAKLAIGSSGPILGIAEKAAGYGFDPMQGRYALGDYGKSMNPMDRIISTLVPLPPVLSDLYIGVKDRVEEGAGFFGFNTNRDQYTERDLSVADTFKGVNDAYGKPITGYNQLNATQRKQWNDQHGALQSTNPDILKKQQDAAGVQASRIASEEAAARQFEKDGNGASFRTLMHEAAVAASAKYEQIYGVGGSKSTNPDDVALTRYYETFAEADKQWAAMSADEQKKLGYDGKSILQQQLLAKLETDPKYMASKPYVDTATMKGKDHEDPTVKAFYDAQKAIRDSGYYAVKSGKADWREAHPVTDALLRRYGYGDLTTKAMDVVGALKKEQSASDAMLAKGELDPKTWRKNLGDRETKKQGAYQGLYGDLPAKEQGPLTEWGKQIDAAKGADGSVDWNQVDKWLAAQPKADQAVIENRVRHDLSPQVAQFHEDQKKIAATQYWDVGDRVAQRFATQMGVPNITSENDLKAAIRTRVLEKVKARGLDPATETALTQTVLDKVMKPVTDITSKVHKTMRESDVELLRLLTLWGYYAPGKKTLGTLIAAGAGQ